MDRDFEAPDLIEVMEEAIRYNRFLIELLSTWCRGKKRVLDFGAGSGRFSAALHERGLDVVAIEPDPGLRQRIAERGIVVRESLAGVEEATLDGAYLINVLEHIADDRAVLEELRVRVRPGGGLFLYVPAFQSLFSANDRRVGHHRRYRLRGLTRLVEASGFEVEDARYVDSIGFVAALWYRWFGSPQGDLDPKTVRFYDRVIFPASRVLDRAVDRLLGKNLLIRAVARSGTSGA